MKLTTHLYLASRLRMDGATPILPPYIIAARPSTTTPWPLNLQRGRMLAIIYVWLVALTATVPSVTDANGTNQSIQEAKPVKHSKVIC